MKITDLSHLSKSGSIITDMNLQFSDYGSLPNDTTVIDTVRNAKSSFNITSVYVTETPTTTVLTTAAPKTVSNTTDTMITTTTTSPAITTQVPATTTTLQASTSVSTPTATPTTTTTTLITTRPKTSPTTTTTTLITTIPETTPTTTTTLITTISEITPTTTTTLKTTIPETSTAAKTIEMTTIRAPITTKETPTPTLMPTTTTTTATVKTTSISTTPSLHTTTPTTTITTTTSTTPTTSTTITTTPTTTTTTPTTTTTTTTTTTISTTVATTTPAPTRPPLAVALQIVIQEVYVVELSNPHSEEFRVLAITVAASFDVVYKARYGILFIRTVVLAFRPGTTRVENVEADVQLIFNENSTMPIPASTEIVSTLKEAISNPNSGFNLTVVATSITVLSVPQTVAVILLTNGTFETALSDSSSDLFINRSSMIKRGLEPFFTADYPSAFSSLSLSNFSDGGVSSTGIRMIQNSMDLLFGTSATLPNTTQIGQTIIRAAKNNSLPFQIFTSKIIVNGTVISSSDVSSKISMFTATFTVAISLLVSRSS